MKKNGEESNSYFYQQALKLARIGGWVFDVTNNSIYWSKMVHHLHETDPGTFRPDLESSLAFYREDFREMVKNLVQNTIETGAEFDFEAVIITKNRHERWVRAIGNAEMIDGKCNRIYGSFQDIHDSKLMELQIREVLDSISDAFYAVDKAWNFTYFNKEAENLLLKKSEDVLGKNIWELFPAGRDTPIQIIYERVARTKKPESFEYYYPGDGKWYEINSYPSQGGISAYFRNIDARKQEAEKLENAYREKNEILESIGDAFFSVNNNWIVTYWNKQAEKILGKKREEILGKNLWDEYADAIDTEFYRQYHRAKVTREILTFEEFYSTLNLWFEVTVYPSLHGLSVYFKDITYRKESEIQLRQSNERFEKVTEATDDAIWDWNIAEGTCYLGAGFQKLFGCQVEQASSSLNSWAHHIHPGDKDRVLQSLYDALEKPGKTNWTSNYRYQRNDGSFAEVADRGVIIRDEKGNAIRMVGAINDITEKRGLEIQLEKERMERQKEITNAVVTAAENEREEIGRELHDNIQQILIGSRMYLSMVRESDVSGAGYSFLQQTNQMILSAIEEIRNLSHSMISPFVETTNLEDALEQVLSNLSKTSGINFSIEATGLDEKKLPEKLRLNIYRIVQEQVNNILKYAKASAVWLTLAQDHDSITLTIKDDGVGFDLSIKPTGIGLLNIRTRASIFNGEVFINSSPGQGFELQVKMKLV